MTTFNIENLPEDLPAGMLWKQLWDDTGYGEGYVFRFAGKSETYWFIKSATKASVCFGTDYGTVGGLTSFTDCRPFEEVEVVGKIANISVQIERV